jgi:DNA-binding NtrC family response regulator
MEMGVDMRKRRVILIDDEPLILDLLRDFFEARGYEVMTFTDLISCPGNAKDHGCANNEACADILLTDYSMLKTTGLQLLETQEKHGCNIPPENKAVLTGFLDDEKTKKVRDLGVMYFEKPLEFDALGRWVEECEQRMDLSVPLYSFRKEARRPCHEEVLFRAGSSAGMLRGVAVNISSSGLCLRGEFRLRQRDIVQLQTKLPIASSQASVRWIRYGGNGSCLAGLQFC